MLNKIALGIAETNQGYANSGVVQRVRLVGTAEVNYTESLDMSVDLNRLTSTSDGFLDEVHGLRDSVQADAVSLWRTPGNFCGIGWLLTNTASNFAASAFSVVGTDCANAPGYTFSHEMGHNMGATHDMSCYSRDGCIIDFARLPVDVAWGRATLNPTAVADSKVIVEPVHGGPNQ